MRDDEGGGRRTEDVRSCQPLLDNVKKATTIAYTVGVANAVPGLSFFLLSSRSDSYSASVHDSPDPPKFLLDNRPLDLIRRTSFQTAAAWERRLSSAVPTSHCVRTFYIIGILHVGGAGWAGESGEVPA